MTHRDGLIIPEWDELAREPNLPGFSLLRELTLAHTNTEIVDRFITDPIPDAEEFSAVAFRQQIEPQCRDAIFEMRRKGYGTMSSGFGGSNAQIVEGILPLTQPVVEMLNDEGYIVFRIGGPSIKFHVEQPDLSIIQAKWDQLAELLPDLGHPAEPTIGTMQEFYDFFRRCTPHIIDWEAVDQFVDYA